nr:hypothetical protein [Bacillus sp. J33]
MAYDLSGHWNSQAFRYYLLQLFPVEKTYNLFPSYPEQVPYIIGKSRLDLGKSFAYVIIQK